ncbi:MAG: PhaM family polyhydroxyalkanoate granule multifunctional regulatory protein [Burkholderiaceae bacterium]
MNDPSAFAKLVPGFDFLQGLVKNAGAALPGIGSWVAPTIDPAELDKRIDELRTVQFWLEQNARMLGATIQALEVQRMTLSTLKTMNVQMEDLRDSLRIRMPTMPAATTTDAAEAAPAAGPAPETAAAPAGAGAAPGAVDPLQWWGALTKQFTELATTAMKEAGSDAARKPAGTAVDRPPEPAGAAPAAKPAAARRKPAATKAARVKSAPRG